MDLAHCLMYKKCQQCSESTECEVFRELNDAKKTIWWAFGGCGGCSSSGSVGEDLEADMWSSNYNLSGPLFFIFLRFMNPFVCLF